MAAKCCECGITYEECEADFANSVFNANSILPLNCSSLPTVGNDGVCPAALPLPPAPPPSPPMQPEPPSPWYGDLLAGLKFSAWLAWLAAGHPAWFPELLHLT